MFAFFVSAESYVTMAILLLMETEIIVDDDYALMAESPTFYSAFGPCMDRLKKMHEKGEFIYLFKKKACIKNLANRYSLWVVTPFKSPLKYVLEIRIIHN